MKVVVDTNVFIMWTARDNLKPPAMRARLE